VVAVKAQLDALMDQRDRRPIKVAGQLEIAVERDADRSGAAEVEPRRWQRPQDLALVREPLGDREMACGVDAPVADAVAPGPYCSSSSARQPNLRAGQNPVFKYRTPPSTEPFSLGVAGVQAVAWKA
jgi:hypothetical protein